MNFPVSTAQYLENKFLPYDPIVINGYCYNSEPENLNEYCEAFTKCSNWYYEFVNGFHEKYPEPEYKISDIVCYAKQEFGFDIQVYYLKDTSLKDKHSNFFGRWEWEDKSKKDLLKVFVNGYKPQWINRYTIPHEIFHGVMDIDVFFQDALSKYSEDTKKRIIERIPEMTTAYLLAPPKYVYQLKREGVSDFKIAQMCNVSKCVISYT